MKRGLLFCSFLALVFTVSCNRGEVSNEELTPLNAAEKYGGVMGKTLKRTKAMEDVLYIKNKINTFHVEEGRYPYSLNELVEKRYLEKLPEPPQGLAFHYDPSTGDVVAK